MPTPFYQCVSTREIREGKCGNCLFWEEKKGECAFAKICRKLDNDMSPTTESERVHFPWFMAGTPMDEEFLDSVALLGPERCPSDAGWQHMAEQQRVKARRERNAAGGAAGGHDYRRFGV